MAEIIPAIMPKNYEDLKNKIAMVRHVVSLVQIDICDGVFVKNTTWPRTDFNHSPDDHFYKIINEEEGLPFWEDIEFELDLMTIDAIENFDGYAKLGPKRIVFHVEAVVGEKDEKLGEFKEFLEGIDMYVRDNIEIGIALNPSTQTEKIFSLVNNVDFVQCMGIDKIGFQGEEFDERCLENIKKIKEKFGDVLVSVDGGVNVENAKDIIKAGADRLVIGSAIFNSSDIKEKIQEFQVL